MTMQIPRQLSALGADMNERIDALNAGGCAVYASHVAARLHRLGVPVWGVVSMAWGGDGVNLNTIRVNAKPRTVYDWNAAGVDFNHVLIQFVHDGRIWTHDSNTTVPKALEHESTCYGRIVEGAMTVRELQTIASKQEGWNRCFHRESGIPEIRSGVRRHLSLRALEVN